MVFGSCWAQGSAKTSGQAQCFAKCGSVGRFTYWLARLTRPSLPFVDSCELALAATGFIWVRYSMVITPINYSLGAVRLLSALLGLSHPSSSRSTFSLECLELRSCIVSGSTYFSFERASSAHEPSNSYRRKHPEAAAAAAH